MGTSVDAPVTSPTHDVTTPTPLQERYDAISAVPIYIGVLIWVVSVILRVAPSLREEYATQGFWLSMIVTGVFLLDLLIRFVIDGNKKSFLRRDWFLIVCIVVPLLRVVLVVSAIRRLRRDRNTLAKMVGLYALYGVLFVVLVGAALVLSFERGGRGAIQSYGDAVWWALETVTTVGYGDFTPVTVQGRSVAAMIMFSGAAAVGALTAVMASRWISATPATGVAGSDGGPDVAGTAPGPQVAGAADAADTGGTSVTSDPAVTAELAALRAQVADLTAAIGALPGARRAGE